MELLENMKLQYTVGINKTLTGRNADILMLSETYFKDYIGKTTFEFSGIKEKLNKTHLE
jgi:hypothetical protein